jgi:hypothetical protein
MSSRASRCQDCGGPVDVCSSPVGCGALNYDTPAVNVAYAAGVDDERARWTAQIRRVWDSYNDGDDMCIIVEDIRKLLMLGPV